MPARKRPSSANAELAPKKRPARAAAKLPLRPEAPPCGSDWFSNLFGFAEPEYDKVAELFRLQEGSKGSTLESLVRPGPFRIGRFDCPSLGELRASGAKLKRTPGALRVSNEIGDVTAMLAAGANRGACFQVASQFNCLEFPGPNTLPEEGVTKYAYDRTQGPACSIACGPATVFRNYFVRAPLPNSKSCTRGQAQGRMIDNLSDVSKLLGNTAGELYEVVGGYTLAGNSKLIKLNRKLQEMKETGLLDKVRAELRVGRHADVQVTATEWGSTLLEDEHQLVTQVFCAACSVAYNLKSNPKLWKPFATLVLEASYEATLWIAALNAHRGGSRRVFLTSLGGGVFGNDFAWIGAAMKHAFEIFKDVDLDVRIVTFAGHPHPLLKGFEEQYRGITSA